MLLFRLDTKTMSREFLENPIEHNYYEVLIEISMSNKNKIIIKG